jgi:asparagine synthase (glutamine-hydrolysing)
VKVTLDGQGADELFGGYALHYQAYFLELFNNRDYTATLIELLYANNNFANRTQLLKTISKKLQERFMSDKKIEDFYKNRHPELQLLRSSVWDSQKHRLKEEIAGVEPGLNAIILKDLRGSTMRAHLRIADRNSMRFGIETRLPFADSKELIEYVQNIAGVYKIRNQQNKSLLRSAIGKFVPPEILREKNKIGFEGPNKVWLRQLAPVLKEAILAPGMEDFLHNRTFYKNWDFMLEKALKGDPHRLFRFAALGLWLKEVHSK